MVPTGTGFRDHYRTRVKKNIDFGEIGASTGFSPVPMDSEMEALLSGGVDAMSKEPAMALAATGSEGAGAQSSAAPTPPPTPPPAQPAEPAPEAEKAASEEPEKSSEEAAGEENP